MTKTIAFFSILKLEIPGKKINCHYSVEAHAQDYNTAGLQLQAARKINQIISIIYSRKPIRREKRAVSQLRCSQRLVLRNLELQRGVKISVSKAVVKIFGFNDLLILVLLRQCW